MLVAIYLILLAPISIGAGWIIQDIMESRPYTNPSIDEEEKTGSLSWENMGDWLWSILGVCLFLPIPIVLVVWSIYVASPDLIASTPQWVKELWQ